MKSSPHRTGNRCLARIIRFNWSTAHVNHVFFLVPWIRHYVDLRRPKWLRLEIMGKTYEFHPRCVIFASKVETTGLHFGQCSVDCHQFFWSSHKMPPSAVKKKKLVCVCDHGYMTQGIVCFHQKCWLQCWMFDDVRSSTVQSRVSN